MAEEKIFSSKLKGGITSIIFQDLSYVFLQILSDKVISTKGIKHGELVMSTTGADIR